MKKDRVVYFSSVRNRLLCWFGIYIAAQLPLASSVCPFWAFPAGIGALFLLGFSEPSFKDLLMFGYFLYAAHLAISLFVRRKQAFLILMFVLVIVVSLNLYSCEALPTIGRVP